MKKISLGSTSNQKREILKVLLNDDYEIYPFNASSEVTEQPLDEDTTLIGAKNRARNAFINLTSAEIGVGMEGGLTKSEGGLFLVCITAIYDGKKYYVGISSKLKLPNKVSQLIEKGGSFGEIIRDHKISYGDNERYSEYLDELINRERLFKESIINAFKIYSHREYH